MKRLTGIVAAGRADTDRVVDTVVLTFEQRRARRGVVVGAGGARYELDRPDAVMLRTGDALVRDDGGLVEVVAEAEPLIEVRAKDVEALARMAWYLGDRHVAVEVMPNRLRLRPDPAMEGQLAALGARIVAIEAPFAPEGGAYLRTDDHGHGHDHDHGHDHADDPAARSDR